jgi:hypothetical protein
MLLSLGSTLRSQGPASLALCALSRPKHLSAPLTTPPSPPQSTACVTPRPSSRAAARRRQPQSPPRRPAAAHAPAAYRSSPSAQASRPRPTLPLLPARAAPQPPPPNAGTRGARAGVAPRRPRQASRSGSPPQCVRRTRSPPNAPGGVLCVNVSNPNSRYLVMCQRRAIRTVAIFIPRSSNSLI